jgi:hypothetical protein
MSVLEIAIDRKPKHPTVARKMVAMARTKVQNAVESSGTITRGTLAA